MVDALRSHNIEAVHWSAVGKFDAPDDLLIDWAKKSWHNFMYDFDTVLALTKAEKQG